MRLHLVTHICNQREILPSGLLGYETSLKTWMIFETDTEKEIIFIDAQKQDGFRILGYLSTF